MHIYEYAINAIIFSRQYFDKSSILKATIILLR